MAGRMEYRRCLAAILAVALVMSACAEGKPDAGEGRAAAESWEEKMESEAAEDLQLQENLALWYNHGLRHGEDPQVLSAAYGGILDYGGGLMGMLEVPEAGIRMPVYHGGPEKGTGLRHDPGTPFPIGGDGNHTVLRGSVGQLDLEEGELFFIHILQQQIPFRVREIVTGQIPPSPPESKQGEELCTLLLEGDGYWHMICGSREDNPD